MKRRITLLATAAATAAALIPATTQAAQQTVVIGGTTYGCDVHQIIGTQPDGSSYTRWGVSNCFKIAPKP